MTAPQTIYALSSGSLPSAISIVRVSGPLTQKLLNMFVGQVPKARYFKYSEIKLPNSKEIIDIALVVFFPSAESITGEDLAEFHIHGSYAVLEDLLLAFSSLEGLKPADPGEFTKQALLNGKMELTQVEALSDLISSETKKQKNQALRQIKGELTHRYNKWRDIIINIRSKLEASLDFVDESDVLEKNFAKEISKKLTYLIKDITKDIERGVSGEKLRTGVKIALIGSPNVGKSSLINVLLNEERAIVSPEAGTTRDVIEARLNLNNIPVTVYDTAGIRKTKGVIEREGVERAKKAANEADIVLLVKDVTNNDKEKEIFKIENKEKVIKIYNKSDLLQKQPVNKNNKFFISCLKEEGIDHMLKKIGERAEYLTGDGDYLGPTRTRHVSHLNETKASLENGLVQHNNKNFDIEAEFLRSASVSLGRIVGKIDVEDVLDELFSSFCIGK